MEKNTSLVTMSKREIINIYEEMVKEGEGDLLNMEIEENKRLQELYEKRLRLLLARDPALSLVREEQIDSYDHLEQHFRNKIEKFKICEEAATEVLERWEHKKGIDMVKCIFQEMGGRVIPSPPQGDETPPPPPISCTGGTI